uniref:Peptidase A2 domain-containing protein n=1 Tax=Amphimedon queenslandica TaxID=400682 RepID=A0A1X7USV9_AMPQE
MWWFSFSSHMSVSKREMSFLWEIGKVCRSSKAKDTKAKSQPKAQRTAPKSTHAIAEGPINSPIIEDSEEVFMVSSLTSRVAPIPVTVIANGQPLEMELDTGAAVSLISEDMYKAKFKDSVTLRSSNITLHSYSGHLLTVMGTADLKVTYKDQKSTLPLVVVAGQGPSLLGRNWLQSIQLDWSSIKNVQVKASFDNLVKKHPKLFCCGLGKIIGVTAKIHVSDHVQPKFIKLRPLPYALKEKVEKELMHLQESGLITPIQFSDWAAPIVPVVKSDGSIRICGDYRVTVNAVAKLESYPLPKVEDLFAALLGVYYSLNWIFPMHISNWF